MICYMDGHLNIGMSLQRLLWSVILLLVSIVSAISGSGCATIEVVNSYSYDGLYTQTSSKCSDRYVYKHIGRHYVLYFVNKHWIIHSVMCVSNGDNSGYARSKDSATYPENIVESWASRIYGEWMYDPDMYVGCEGEEQNLSDGAIIGIVLACISGSFVLVTIMVAFVKATVKRRRKKHHSGNNDPGVHLPRLSSDPPASNIDVETSLDHGCGHPNLGFDTTNPDYPGPVIGCSELPSYEEAIQAHKKHYGTDHTDPPPAYEENTESVVQNSCDLGRRSSDIHV